MEDLRSELDGINYARLKELLCQGKWKEADRETSDRLSDVMVALVPTIDWEALDIDFEVFDRNLVSKDAECLDILPSKDVKIVDRLWIEASGGKFGFSVQKRIWQECGGTAALGSREEQESWGKFGDRVGWRVGERWIDYRSITLSPISVDGHLPVFHFRESQWDFWEGCGAWPNYIDLIYSPIFERL